MSVLVTGHTGLLGSEVTSLCRNYFGLSSKDCDLTNRLEVTKAFNDIKPETVIHCAAKVGGIQANIDCVADFYDLNVIMNLNILEQCRIHDCKLVSILSTCIYPDKDYVTYPLTENQLHLGPPHISNFGYAYAKRMLEVQTQAYRQQWGCRFICAIPNNLYGLNDNYDLNNSHVIPALIRKFYEAKINNEKSVTLWGNGEQKREFTFARDIAKIVLWLAENYQGDDPINIGNVEEISISDLAEIIKNKVGYHGKILWNTDKPSGQFRKPSSNKRLIDLGWHEEYTPLEIGINETVNFFKNNYHCLRGIS